MMCRIQRISCGIVNCYLLKGERGAVLLDAGNANDCDRIVRAIGNTPINLILLTHGHTDHIGAAAELSEKFNVPIAMHEADVPLITAPSARKLYGHTFLGRILASASESTMSHAKVKPFEPKLLVDEGFDLESYGVNAHVVALPGHTAGSVGVVTNTGDMIVGDAAFHMLRPTSARLYEDRATMEKSVEKIKRLCSGRIYVGHGSPMKAAAIER